MKLQEFLGQVQSRGRMATMDEALRATRAVLETLAERLGGEHRIFPDAGHTVPIEAALAWRAAVEDFLQ